MFLDLIKTRFYSCKLLQILVSTTYQLNHEHTIILLESKHSNILKFSFLILYGHPQHQEHRKETQRGELALTGKEGDESR